ncbi:MAG: hypothetical protein WD894_06920 [Pirellulales bacterium]
MSRSLKIVALLIMFAAGSALWIGKSLAQSAAITSSSQGAAANSSYQVGQGGYESNIYAGEAGDGVSPEAARLRQADHAHAQSTRALVAKHQQSSDSQERESLREELNKVIAEHFETRQQMRARELEELEAQVRHLRTLHDRRKKEKDQIVGDRLQRLLRDADGLGWGSDDGDAGNLFRSPATRRSVSSSPARASGSNNSQ